MRLHDNALKRGVALERHRCWPGQGRAVFSPVVHLLLIESSSPLLQPLTLHCQRVYTTAPTPLAGQSPRASTQASHSLHRTVGKPLPPPAAPSCAVLASVVTDHTSSCRADLHCRCACLLPPAHAGLYYQLHAPRLAGRASPVAPPPARPRRPPPLYCPPLPRAARLHRTVSSGRQIRLRRHRIQPRRAGYGHRRCPRHDPKPRRCAACPTCQSASSRRDGAQPWGVWPCCHHPGVPRGFRWQRWGNEGFAPGSSACGRRGGGEVRSYIYMYY